MTRYVCCALFGVCLTVTVMPLVAMLLIEFTDFDLDLRETP